MTPMPAAARPVRRRVHYFSGFDPRGAGYYHRLFRAEAATGGRYEMGPRRRQDRHYSHWTAQAREVAGEAGPPSTECVFMGWDDVIRRHWLQRPWALLAALFWGYGSPIARAGLPPAYGWHRGAFWTGVLPLVYVLLALLLTLALGALAWGLVSPWLALPLVPALLYGFYGLAEKLGVWWLMRIFAFNVRMGRGPVPGLAQRQAAWREQLIAAQQADPVDEVVLVAHSVGTLVVVEMLDALLADPRWQAVQQGRPTYLLTLGHCIPFVALAPAAQDFRAALARLCTHPDLQWCDVTAKIDPLCFYQVHPLAGTGLAEARAPRPRRLAARFFQMYTASSWARIRRNKLQTHFLYLMTPEQPGNFNLYDWLFGAMPLAERFKES
jgi:hypothetical protein